MSDRCREHQARCCQTCDNLVDTSSTPDARAITMHSDAITPDDRDALELAVATAIRDERRHRWEPVHEGECIIDARAAIQAVLTSGWLAEVKAQAWDEGNAACCEPAYVHLNPYRADRIEGDTHDMRDDLQREFGGGL